MLKERLLQRLAQRQERKPKLLFVDAQPLSKHARLGLPLYSRFIEKATGISRITVVNLAEKGKLPDDPSQYDGIVFGGSKHDLREKLKWMEDEQGFMEAATKAQVPILAFCFGHQLYGALYGGELSELRDKVVGYKTVTKTDAGKRHPLLRRLRKSFLLAASHKYYFEKTPSDSSDIIATEIADGDPPNAIIEYTNKDGKHLALTTQLHPELANAIPAFASATDKEKPTMDGILIVDRRTLRRYSKRAEKAGRRLVRNWVKQQVIPHARSRAVS